jgi:Xaa-Pro dipeptidase
VGLTGGNVPAARPNLRRAWGLMKDSRVDALLASSPVNVRYLTGYGNWLAPWFREYMVRPGGSDDLVQRNFALLPVGNEPILIADTSFAIDAVDSLAVEVRIAGAAVFARGEPSGIGAVPVGDRARELLTDPARPDDPVAAVAAVIEEHGLEGSRIGIEPGAMPASERLRLAEALPGVSFLGCDALLRLVRAVKTESEIETLAHATEIGEDAAREVVGAAGAGTTPTELVDRFRLLVAQRGADLDHFAVSLDGLGFVTGGDRPLRADSSMYSDFGCIFRGRFSDAGTTIFVGEPEQRALDDHAAVRDAVQAGAEAIRPGVRGSAVERAMRESLADAGITESFPHGHGLGLEAREHPLLVAPAGRTIRDDCVEVDADMTIEPNMVLNLEAGLLVVGTRSVQCERTFVVTADGCRPLAAQDRERPLVAGAGAERRASLA